MPKDVVGAMAFPSVEDADFYRVQLKNGADDYEICELTENGRLMSVPLP